LNHKAKIKKRITILGAGESGTGAALLAKVKGYNVFVSDNGFIKAEYKDQLTSQNITFEENGHSIDKILESSLVIKSPGIPDTIDLIKNIESKGIEIIDEIEFASQFTEAKVLAVTGTNGKTTTALLAHHILAESGYNVGLAGNVGHSFSKLVKEANHDFYVIEISSFQLDRIKDFKPHVSILLNITPDHLDRYENMEAYAASKLRIIKNQTTDDHFIACIDNDLIAQTIGSKEIIPQLKTISLSSDSCSGFLKNGVMHFDGFVIDQKDTSLLGPHNAVNMMSAVLGVKALGVKEGQIRKALKSFKNAAHRLEYVTDINDVAFVNDSKATNIDSVKYALESFSEPLVWIAGGIDKGNDYDLIMESVNKKVKALVCLGKDNEKLREAFHEHIIHLLETNTMEKAVRSALEYAEANDVVLLSPACASFDLFKNYEDRGDQFKACVMALKKEFENKSINQ